MKIIKYQIMTEVNYGTEETPVVEQVFQDVMITCTADNLESNVEIAKAEAYKGEYTIEDDGVPEEITQADRIEAQVTYTAMMTDTLLEV
jgi:hypothetical protein